MKQKEWTAEQRKAASDRMKAQQEKKREQTKKQALRLPMGIRRDITAVRDTPSDAVDRFVNDVPGRVHRFKQAGYENVTDALIGDSHVDGTHCNDGVVSRDMGQGVTAYLMRQRRDHYEQDQAAKQKIIAATEDAMRRNINDDRNDGFTGEVKIG